MKKKLKPILITVAVLAGLTGGGIYLLGRGGKSLSQFEKRIASEQSDQSQDRAYRHDTGKTAVELLLSGENKNVLNFDHANIYDTAESQAARDRLDRVIKKTDVDFENPIIAANPFGTNDNTFYFRFDTEYKGMVRYTITVEDESIPDHVRYVNNGQEKNLTKQHEFIVSGLVPGMTNYLIIEVLDSSGASRDKLTYKYTVPAAKLSNKIPVETGKSKQLAENGLYFVFPSGEKDIYIYDNSGILRDVVGTESAHGSRIYQSGDSAIYQVSDKKVAKVSSLGMVKGVTTVKGYGKIQDFSYDGYDNIYCLVQKKGRQYLVSASFETGKTKRVYTFPKDIKTKSLTTPVNGTMYVACSSPGGIMKLEAVTSARPEISYVLGKKADWKKITKKDKSLKKKIIEEETAVRWDVSGAVLNLNDQVSDGKTDTISTYLVEKDKGTGIDFSIQGKENKVSVNISLPTGQSSACSGQTYGDHFVITDLGAGSVTEYDEDGKTVKTYSMGHSLEGMTKMTLNGMCFYSGN